MKAGRARKLAAALALALLAVAAVLLAWVLPLGRALEAVAARVDDLGPWGPPAYGTFCALAVVLMVPATPLTIVAGAAFGPVVGAITATVALNLGSTLSFLGARYLAREAVAGRLRRHPRAEAIRRMIASDGWRLVVLLRLSPLVPFGLQNLAHGLTAIPFRSFALAGALGMLPATLLYVTLGDLGRSGLASPGPGRAKTPLEWAILLVGVAATAALLAQAARMARRSLNPADRPEAGP